MIQPQEIEIIGNWLVEQGVQKEDEACLRISKLVTTDLEQLGRDESGWDVLYRDPRDGRLWELTYPKSELQGGGPPHLRCVSMEQANRKYLNIMAMQRAQY